MKRICLVGGLLVAALLGISSITTAGPLYAVSNELGYRGTVWNITRGTDPVATTSPRNADLYLVSQAPQVWTDYNQLLSSWFSHTASNQNDSFMQLVVDGAQSPWTAIGGWDPSLTTFNLTVTGGHDGPWATSNSRFWQPDKNVAWGVTFLGYEYSFVATFAKPAVVKDGWYVSDGAPSSITGSFHGSFQRSQESFRGPEILNGDTYGFMINFDREWSTDPDYSADGWDYSPYTEVGAPVPEPATLGLLALGLIGGARAARRRNR